MGIFDRIADQLGDLIAPDDVRARVERAEAFLAERKLDEAVEELRAALQLKPDHARAAHLMAVALERQGNLEGAEAALVMAATARQDYAEALVELGRVRQRLGRVEAAGEAFRRALEAGPADVRLRGEAHRGAGAVYLALGQKDKAVRELRKAAALLPEDVEVQGLLGRAFAARGDVDLARIALERVAAGPEPDVEALLALGGLYRRLGRPGDAEMAYLRAFQVQPDGVEGVAARLGLAAARLDLGDAPGAEGQAREALHLAAEEGAGGIPPADPIQGGLVRAAAEIGLGRALAGAGTEKVEAALDAFAAALERLPERAAESEGLLALPGREALLDEALHLALRAGLDGRALEHARALVALRPEDPDALAALALGQVAAGDLVEAEALVRRAQGGPSFRAKREGLPREEGERAERATVETLLAQARLDLAGSAQAVSPGGEVEARAAAALRRALALAPSDPRPRARLAALYRQGSEAPPADLYGLLRATHRHLMRRPELADLAPEASRIQELLDRPLLVTVMGEFNAGKSTFVNALLGEEVAPMGIVPTTSTINVLKYGAERGARVVYRDETVREVAWGDVGALLRGLGEEEARRIRQVEVRCPLAALERVNVVDTPGLNSILPEHEQTAREFIAQADAVIWLFTVGQAGTASEKEALERVRAEKKKVLGVVNKIDRASPGELEEILAHVGASFGELVEALVPFSAREALLGRGDPERLARSNRAELDRVLEERFFARSAAIKRAASAHRLRQLCAEASGRGARLLAAGEGRRAEIAAALAAVRADRELFTRRFLVEERVRMRDELDELLRAGAREVLDFVRPRRWVFGSNEAQPADRDFLVTLAEEKVGTLAGASRGRVAAQAERTLAVARPLLGGESSQELEGRLDLEVYGRFGAFVRGYLRGGRVDDFFARVLPKLELSEPALRRALELGMLNAEVVDQELVAPLKAWGERFHRGLCERLARLGEAEELARFEIEERLVRPIEALGAVLDTL